MAKLTTKKRDSIGKKALTPQRKNDRYMSPMDKLSKGMKGLASKK